ncbi:phosphoribosyltransferase family protein [Pseudonocardia bannensis]|uniref:Phosphoribosyltransferase n=1 Tax=Pseudonocardia bannensis TaxID=630973 RepID=A0A848DID2_9PSEU|nr:phosphoribosyltransferase family protein [Pseudonocardia bannensis]NMH92261.1 phosphoribosyltransferase [Pseudonocardia bannensis]
MLFDDRIDAGRQLAGQLTHLRGQDVLVLGLPRGGVPVALQVARAIGAPLDVIVVRKLGVPFQPELAMGAIGEEGARVIDARTVRLARVGRAELAAIEDRERAELHRRVRRFRGDRPPIPVAGRTAVLVDDGVATGATARAACLVARARGAERLVLAVPVAPMDWTRRLNDTADELVCVATPRPFEGIGKWYRDFSPTPHAEVVACLEAGRPEPDTSDPPVGPSASGAGTDTDTEVEIELGTVSLAGHLTVPADAPGVVVFAHGTGSSRASPRNRAVAAALQRAGFGTLLFDLLAPDEVRHRSAAFDVALSAERLAGSTRWLRAQPAAAEARIGWFGAGTGAAAALWAAAEPDADVDAVVSRGGRPDLAAARLTGVRAPTLLAVGGRDRVVLDLNRRAARLLRCPHQLTVVPGASHLFEEPGALDAVAGLAADWFVRHLAPAVRRTMARP